MVVAGRVFGPKVDATVIVYVVGLDVLLASGGGIHGPGAKISGLYFLLVVSMMMNFLSESLCDFIECFNTFSFLA